MPNQGDKSDKAGQQAHDQELFRDLSSFRKEALKVSETDQAKWREEAHRAAHGQPPLPPEKPPEEIAAKKEESRWDRIQREQRKKQIAFGLLACSGVALVLQLDVGGNLRSMLTFGRKAQPSPSATATALPPPVAGDTQQMAERYLVSRWELDSASKHPEYNSIGEEPYRYDWTS